MSESIDPATYVRTPRLDVPSTISLGKMLLGVVPKDANANVKKAANRLHDAVVALATAFQRQDATPLADVDIRVLDRRLDNLWAAVNDRLAAYAALDDASKDRARAASVQAALFPDGMSFLKLPYAAEHAESDKRLNLIAEGKLDKELTDLVGDEFLTDLRSAHEAYGDAQGITRPLASTTTAPALADPLRIVNDAIRRYAVQLVAFADDDKQIPAVKRALEPIDKFRANQISRAPTPPDAPPPEAPVQPPPTQ